MTVRDDYQGRRPVLTLPWEGKNEVRFKGVNLAPKVEGVAGGDGYSSSRAQRGFEVFR